MERISGKNGEFIFTQTNSKKFEIELVKGVFPFYTMCGE
jgi:hypothetical protein